ncbi:AraC family transcriptional regulator [Marinomonas phaeophyticola]|uniref:AraC family transcriptional regulator n=1 Tax=Marinomonas phaeophyticola TaxID=3004091 RepID=UPI003D17B158
MQAVCEYIYQHLDDDLTIEQLSVVACFSKHHFHRQFSHYMGMSTAKFIQQLRLKKRLMNWSFKRTNPLLILR